MHPGVLTTSAAIPPIPVIRDIFWPFQGGVYSSQTVPKPSQMFQIDENKGKTIDYL